MKPTGLRSLAAMVLVLILYPAFAGQANALGVPGEVRAPTAPAGPQARPFTR